MPKQEYPNMAAAVEARDANAVAQMAIAADGLDAAREWVGATAAQYSRVGSPTAAFWQDVETLLRLETASDEPPEPSAPKPDGSPTWTDADRAALAALLAKREAWVAATQQPLSEDEATSIHEAVSEAMRDDPGMWASDWMDEQEPDSLRSWIEAEGEDDE